MSGRIGFIKTGIEGLTLIERKPLGDHRGFLERMFCVSEFESIGLKDPVRQINRTYTSKAGTVRGLHFQRPPYAETKIVTCVRGRVFDVAVDLRQGSPTFLKWYGVELAGDNFNSLFIPEGFAHGLQALENDCEMLYLHTRDYAPGAEDGLNACDPSIGVAWPKEITEMSERDKALVKFDDQFLGLEL